MLSRTLRLVGVDRATALAMAGNMASLAIGPVTALLVALKLTPEVQGFYYTFGSLSVLQMLAEFGLGQALLQFASHEWPRLRMGPGGIVTGNGEARGRLSALARIAAKWCLACSAFLLPVLVITGEYLFSRNADTVAWRAPWFAVICGLLANFFLAPVWALLQGCHQISAFWTYRLVQQILNGFTLWTALLAGAGLWSAPIAVTVGLGWSIVFLFVRFPRFLSSVHSAPPTPVKWVDELWPLQWRTAISWLGANFTSYLFVPVVFRLSGSTEAGKIGMTVTLATVLVAFASSVTVTRAPAFGSLVAQGRFAELDATFFRLIAVVAIIAVAGAAAVVLFVLALNRMECQIASRLMSPTATALLMGYASATAILVGIGTYLRSYKRDPLSWLNIVGSFLIIVLGALWTSRAGSIGIAMAACVVAFVVQLPWALRILITVRPAWQSRRVSS